MCKNVELLEQWARAKMSTLKVIADNLRSTTHALLNEFSAHAEKTGAHSPQVELVGCFKSAAQLAHEGARGHSAGIAQFELWWLNSPSLMGDTMLWERWECPSLTRAQYDDFLTWAAGTEARLTEVADSPHWNSGPKPLTPGPLWKYHPERFRGGMPYSKQVETLGKRCNGWITPEVMRQISDAWIAAAQAKIHQSSIRARNVSQAKAGRRFIRLSEMLFHYAAFCAHGRQIFDIPPQLSEMFSRTDVDDVTAEQLKLPYTEVYLHFGPQSALALEDGWIPEGAYVQEMKGDTFRVIQIGLTFAPPDLQTYQQFELHPEPFYSLAIPEKYLGLPLSEALDLLLAEKLKDLQAEEMQHPLAQAQKEAAQAGVELVSLQSHRARQERAALPGLHRTGVAMLRLVVNSLIYLTAYPKDIETTWPKTAPTHLLKELGNTKSRNEQARILSRLAAQGYTPVHLCGQSLVRELSKQAQSPKADGAVAAHWRRGHWRRQPHGPQNALRKLVWLRPTLVNAGNPEDASTGHIYQVS